MSGLRIVALMTCHNRVDMTLQAVASLQALAEQATGLELLIILVDDGSTDGTSDAVSREHPDVQIIPGSGNLYWAGGMVKAYNAARRASTHFDGYLLVNDDVTLNLDASSRMVNEWSRWYAAGSPVILVGATQERPGGELSYGGYRQSSGIRLLAFERLCLTPGRLTRCDTFNANFVLVPGRWFEARGGLDRRYRHGLADFDLGLDARRDGIAAYVYGEFVGVCPRGRPRDESLLMRARRDRLKMLFVRPYSVKQDLVFARKHRPPWLMPLYLANALVRRAVLVARKRSPLEESARRTS